MSVSTEHFVSNFILDTCPNIIIVIGTMTQEEERMINFIKSKLHSNVDY